MRKQAEAAEQEKGQVLKELDSTKRLIEEEEEEEEEKERENTKILNSGTISMKTKTQPAHCKGL